MKDINEAKDIAREIVNKYHTYGLSIEGDIVTQRHPGGVYHHDARDLNTMKRLKRRCEQIANTIDAP